MSPLHFSGNEDETSLLDALSDIGVGIWQYDHLADRLTYSPGLQSMIGGDFPPPKGATLADFFSQVHPDDVVLVQNAIEKSILEDTLFDVEYRFLRAHQNWMWLRARGRVTQRADDGSPQLSLGIKSDISPRRRQDEQQHIQQEFSQQISVADTPVELAQTVLQITLKLSELDGGGIYLRQKDHQFKLIADSGLSQHFLDQLTHLDLSSTQLQIITSDELICSCTVSAEHCSNDDLIKQPLLKAEGVFALLMIPIKIDGKVIAFLSLASKHAHLIPADGIQFLENLANQLGHAFERLETSRDAKQQRDNLEGFFQALNDYIFIIDCNGLILSMNQAVKDQLGYDEKLLGKSIFTVHPERTHEDARHIIEQMQKQDQVSCTLPVLRADHTEILVDLRIVRGFWNNQPALLGIARDITELQQAKDKLAAGKALLRATLDATADGILVISQDKRIITFNKRLRAIWKIPEPFLTSDDDFPLLQHIADQVADTEQFLALVAEINASDEVRFDRLTLKDGRTLERYTEPLSFAGQVSRVWSFRDVTKRENALAELQSERSMLQTLVETIPDMVWLKDPDGVFLFTNPATEAFMQQAPGSVVGGRDEDFFGEKLGAELRKRDLEAMEAAKPLVFKETVNAPDKETMHLETIKTAMRNPDGSLIGILGIARDVTEAHNAEAAIRAADERRKQLMETSADGIAIINQEHLIIEGNAQCARMLGYTQEEMLKLHTWDWEANLSEEDIRTAFSDLTTINVKFQTRHKRKDGSIFDVEVSASGIEVNGEPSVITIIRDISERVAIQNALTESRDRLNALIQQAADGIVLVDTETLSFVEFNDAAHETLGYTRDEFAELDLYDINPNLDRSVVKERMEQIVQHGSLDFETTHQHKNGTERTMRVTNRTVESGGRYYLVAIWTDITEQKKAALALKAAEARWKFALNGSGLGVWDWNIKNDSIYFSPIWKRMLGYADDELENSLKTWESRLHPDDKPHIFHTLEQHIQGIIQDYVVEFRLRNKAGDWQWIQARGLVVERDELGKPTRMIGVHVDIQAHKAAEAELNQHRHHLEELVNSRTQELAIAKEAANRTKSAFLANMSHEIRTPMNAVLGLADMGIRQTKDTENRKLFNQIHESGQHLLGVINDILDISKIEAGKFTIEPRVVQLIPTIEHSVGLLLEKAKDKNLAFQVHYATNLPEWVELDSLRLRQILNNLLSNAIKFTEQGSVSLSAGIEQDQLKIVVADTGIGIDAELKKRLFAPFEQADVSTTRKFGGTGLGLAISYNLAKLMGGDIDVSSTPGTGTVFNLVIPVVITEAPHRQEPSPQPTQDGQQLAGLSLLAAEDVEINRLILEDMVTSEGACIEFAENGQQVLDLLKRQGACAFHAILMDIQMPIMDGYEATRRALELAPKMPIIALTAHALEEEALRCKEAGMLDRITKPIDPDELVATVLKHTRLQQ